MKENAWEIFNFKDNLNSGPFMAINNDEIL